MSLVKIEPFITDNVANFTFGGLTITANAVFGNANLGNLATANFVSVASNITSGNANLGNVATANYFVGNGSLLTGISATTAISLVNGNSNVVLAANSNASISIGGTSNVAVFTTTGANITGYVNATRFLGEAGNLSNIQGANVTGAVALATSATTAGTVTTAAQPNITSLGLLANLSVNGNSSFIGNANIIGNINLSGGNANLGNSVTANYFTGNGSLLTSVTGANITGYVPNANIANTAYAVAVANVIGIGNIATINKDGNASNILYGNGVFAAAPAAGSSYTNSNVSAFLASYGSNTISTTGNITGGNIIGNGQALASLTGANVTGQVANALVAGTVYTAAQPNITSVGTLSSLSVTNDVTVGGNLTVNGVTTTVNSTTVIVNDINLVLANNAANASVANGAGITINGAGATILYNSTSNAFTFSHPISANGSLLTSIAGANVTGQVGNALVAGTVTTASQPNITSVGTLSSLIVTGNITSGNANLGNAAVANYFVGNGSLLTGIVSTYSNSNVASYLPTYTGNLTAGNANLGNSVVANFFTGSGAGLTSVIAVTAGTITTNAQPNITSVGTLTSVTIGNSTNNTTINASSITSNANVALTGSNISLGPIGNIKITGGTSGYFITTDGTGNLSWGAASGGGGVSATGSNTQLQFNDSGSLGASANLTFDKTTKTLTVDKAIHISGANLGSNVSNVYIGGGSANQILKTDGAGNLTWVAQPVASITVDNFTGDGTTTQFTLSVTPTSINQTVVNYNGAFQLRAAYSLSGTTITFSEAPVSGSKVEVTTTLGAMSGAGAFVTRSYAGTGSLSTFTVTSGCTVNSVIVTENGLVQTPTTDYTISGTTLTFATPPANGIVIQIRELAIAIVTGSGTAITVQDEGSNITTTAALLNFVGAGVTATNSGSNVTVTIPSGGNNAMTAGYSLVFGG